MKKEILITLLCVGLMLVTPFTTIAQENKASSNLTDESDVEPKDYLFQIIIDIANNPEVKKFLEQYKYDLFKVDIDRSVYRKIFFRNPRLFSSLIFTKPSMSIDYLNKCYNNGIEITNILGEEKVLEMIESVEVIDTEVFNELHNILTTDEEFSNKIASKKEINNKLNYDGIFSDICSVLWLLFIPFMVMDTIITILYNIFEYTIPIISLLLELIIFPLIVPFGILIFLLVVFDCIYIL